MTIKGTKGNDVLKGTAGNDVFDLSQGGNDRVSGLAGDDTFKFAGTFSGNDKVNGGAGDDTLSLAGNYSDRVILYANSIVSVETIALGAGHDYSLKTNDANVANHATLTVDGSNLGIHDTLKFNGAGESNGHFNLIGGNGSDSLAGGARSDTFNLSLGGNDAARGGEGNDTFNMAAAFTASDIIRGGTGNDTVALNGGGAVAFTAATMRSVEKIALHAGHDYSLTTSNATVAAGEILTVDASALGASNALDFNGSHERDGSFHITGGAGDDTVTFGNYNSGNSFEGGAGHDTLVLDGSGYDDVVANFSGVETVKFAGAHDYGLIMQDGQVAAGKTLTVDASALSAGHYIAFDGSAETDGHFNLIGSAGDDQFTGGSGGDTFDMTHGGEDRVTTGTGTNTINFGDAFDSGDQISGHGNDTVELSGGAYADSLAITGNMMNGVSTLSLAGGNNYDISLADDSVVASGQLITVDATAMGAGDTLTFDGSAETDGFLSVLAGAGTVHLTGGALNDEFNLGANFDSSDTVDGGGGPLNTIDLDGDYSAGLTITSTMMTNIHNLDLADGHSYKFVLADGLGQLEVDGSGLTSGSLYVDGSAETTNVQILSGGAGDDTLIGGGGNDQISLGAGGSDTAKGNGGSDVFNVGDNLAGSTIDGGSGNDIVGLSGDYSAGVTLAADTLTSVETLSLAGGDSYKLTMADGNVASGETLTVNATFLGSGDTLTFDGSAETDGHFNIITGAGNDVLKGGHAGDTFDLSHGGEDTATSGGGGDTFNMGGALDAGDKITGGAGNDTVNLDGSYAGGNALTFGATTMTGVENLNLASGHSYDLTTNDATAASGATLKIDASALGSGNTLTFDGSAETDGHFNVIGGAGNDVLKGGHAGDTFDLSHGGHDTVTSGGGGDTFNMGAALDAGDKITGGTGSDTVNLDGDYSAGLTFNATTMTGVENLNLAAGHSYDLTTNDATVASGTVLTIDASALGGSDTLTFDGSAETDGHFNIIAGAGDDVLKGGHAGDTFDLSHGGHDTVTSGGGGDTFDMGAALDAGDKITGGAGSDTVNLDGDYSAGLTFNATTMTGVENLNLAAGNDYNLTTADETVASGATLKIDASALDSGNTLTFDGSAETDGHFNIIAGAGDDVLKGGHAGDTFDLSHGGHDTVTSGGGGDTFNMGAALDAGDKITGGGGTDTVNLDGDYSGGVVFNATTMTGVENLNLAAGNDYNLTTADETVASGATLTIDASALGSGNSLTFDGSAETDGHFNIIAGAGNDVLKGGHAGDVFDLTHGGEDTVTSGGGGDTVNMGTALDAGDKITGGAGSDTVNLNGDYSAGLTFGATTMTGVEKLVLANGNSYSLTTNDATVAAGATLIVDASAFTGFNNKLTFNGSAETDGHFDITVSGGAYFNSITGGALSDTIDTSAASYAHINGGGGDDIMKVGANLTGAVIDGGTGNDTVVLSGDYYYNYMATTIGAGILTSVETLQLSAGNNYDLVLNDANIASGQTLTIDGSAISDVMIIDVSHETNGYYDIKTGSGNSNSIFAGANLNATDKIEGQASGATLFLDGDYSAGLTLSGAKISNLSEILFNGGNTYTFTTDDALVGAGKSLQFFGGGTLNLDASAETDGFFQITTQGGNDSLKLGSETTLAGTTYTAGGGNDTLELNGDFSTAITINGTNYTGIETLKLDNGHDYNIGTSDAFVGNGGTLTVDASALGASHTLTFDGTAETNGGFAVTGGAGDDTLILGTATALANSTFSGGGGNDTLELNGAIGTGYNNAGEVAILGANAFSGVETLTFDAGHNYFISIHNNSFGSGASTVTIDAGALGAGNSLYFDGTGFFTGSGTVNTSFAFIGGAGSDILVSGNAASTFDLTEGGSDTADGGLGNDIFNLGSKLNSGDSIAGQGGNDTVNLDGDYSAGLTFSNNTIADIDTLHLANGNSYKFTTADNNVFSGATMAVDASDLTGSHALTLDATAETDGFYAVTGGAGDDTLTLGSATVLNGSTFNGGGGNDTLELNLDITGSPTLSSGYTNISTVKLDGFHQYGFYLDSAMASAGQTVTLDASGVTGYGVTVGVQSSATWNFHAEGSSNGDYFYDGGGNDTLNGNGGNDNLVFQFGGTDIANGGAGNDTLSVGPLQSLANMTMDGGTGSDALYMSGDYAGGNAFTFSATTMVSVESITVNDGYDYDFTTNDATVASAATFTIDGTRLTADSIRIDGSAETDGFFAMTGGAGDDTLKLNSPTVLAGSSFNGGAGNDTLELGGNVAFSSATITFSATTMTNVETLKLDDGTVYKITTNDANVGAGKTLTVDATALGNDSNNHPLTFDGSAETDGNFLFIFKNSLIAQSSTITGGAGSDTIELAPTAAGTSYYSLFGSALKSVENLTFATGHTYNVALINDGTTVAALTVDASNLTGSNYLTLDASNDATRAIDFTGGHGSDSVFFGSAAQIGASTFDGGAGSNTVGLSGDFSSGVTLSGSNLSNVQVVSVSDGHDYNVTTMDSLVGSGSFLTVNAYSLTGSHALTFDGSAETDGAFSFTGGAGNDVLTGGHGDDYFDFTVAAGNDTAHGGAGNDTFKMGANMTSADHIDGGTGSDTLILNGDYSGGVTFSTSTISNISTISLTDGHSYNITDNVYNGETLNVDASALTGSNALSFTAGASAFDSFNITGGAGADTATFTTNYNTGDLFDGGAGNDTLVLHVDKSGGQIVFGSNQMTSVETLDLTGNFNYSLITDDANVAAGKTMTIDASGLTGSGYLEFQTYESDGHFNFIGSANNDDITMGGGGSTAFGGLGADLFSAGAGADTFVYTAVNQSTTAAGADGIYGLNFAMDKIDLNVTVNAIDGAVTGNIRVAQAETDIANLVAGHLGAHDAILVHANDPGGYPDYNSLTTFLVIDADGSASYTSGDYVIAISGTTGTLTTATFI